MGHRHALSRPPSEELRHPTFQRPEFADVAPDHTLVLQAPGLQVYILARRACSSP